MQKETIIELKNVCKVYDGKEAVKNARINDKK